ncbi:anaerobic ribonucleoside-triphosphate reductase activating protein [Pollutimonas bauzanensis]|uniref:anaerobic ribonucleoside-triphosphate reductase activating protein n=1 Tax=Pollutimonas bauzanensis TaxID=658167 RepID=UPI000934A86C|nr:anaerobic ribonucleoside-triphosphate reductase activating protein [Pollutimonas bauzanensis]
MDLHAGRQRMLKVGGVTPFTATDYPGQLAAAVFVQGCPWRCGYCHNPHLQERTRHSPIAWTDVLGLLKRRIGLIDAVVFSGGEPTMDPCLADAIAQVRALGFKIGLHSGGTHPQRLKSILPLLDWVGLDVKAMFANYANVTQVGGSGGPALASLEAVLASGVDYECRTTAHPALLPETELWQLAQALAGMQVKNYVLQVFRMQGCSDPALNNTMTGNYPSAGLVQRIAPLFPAFTLRRA